MLKKNLFWFKHIFVKLGWNVKQKYLFQEELYKKGIAFNLITNCGTSNGTQEYHDNSVSHSNIFIFRVWVVHNNKNTNVGDEWKSR